MSSVPIIAAAAASKAKGKSKGSDDDVFFAVAISAPFVLPMLAVEGVSAGIKKLVGVIKENAQTKARKKEYEKALEKNKELSEGKVGSVEVLEDKEKNTKTTIIYTENGPLVKTEKFGKVASVNDEGEAIALEKIRNKKIFHNKVDWEYKQGVRSISYSGFMPVADEKGKESLIYMEDVSFSRASSPEYVHEWSEYAWNRTFNNKAITKNGQEISNRNISNYGGNEVGLLGLGDTGNNMFDNASKFFNQELEKTLDANVDQQV